MYEKCGKMTLVRGRQPPLVCDWTLWICHPLPSSPLYYSSLNPMQKTLAGLVIVFAFSSIAIALLFFHHNNTYNQHAPRYTTTTEPIDHVASLETNQPISEPIDERVYMDPSVLHPINEVNPYVLNRGIHAVNSNEAAIGYTPQPANLNSEMPQILNHKGCQLEDAFVLDPSLPKPDFMLIGVAKGGTTSFYNYLCSFFFFNWKRIANLRNLAVHPNVKNITVKEPNFWSWKYMATDTYQTMFIRGILTLSSFDKRA